MAAPAILNQFSFAYRDAKGQVATARFKIGGATEAAVTGSATTLKGHLAAITNASVRCVQLDPPVVIYGAASVYQDVEDKLELVWQQPSTGAIHRYRLPAPINALFLADGETPNPANAAFASVVTDIGTFVYGNILDTGPLQYLGGIRTRSRYQRRTNLLTKDPTLTNPAE